jgi:hypothetical protein
VTRFWILDFGFWIVSALATASGKAVVFQSKIQNPKSKIASFPRFAGVF